MQATSPCLSIQGGGDTERERERERGGVRVETNQSIMFRLRYITHNKPVNLGVSL